MEMIKLLTRLIRQASKIVRSVVGPGSRDDRKNDVVDNDSKKTLKVLCYDATSWVRESFEPKVKAFNESATDLKLEMDFTHDRLDVITAKFAAG